ncbi:protocatechuate 3,4-dioxygenase subunit beta [Fodinicurvata halophila]|uniref:Protocatechuate 3,4-dioxygenase subunit beta n=1 Tax=Fodinicurvata halophila TaxID=1419723 RepID=A0ABV8UQG5_9PROT
MAYLTRRIFLLSGPLALAGAAFGTRLPALAGTAPEGLTPSQTEGPFYPDSLPAERDNNLVRLAEADSRAEGEILELQGRVLDADGTPFPECRIEIWQADAGGRYLHSGDDREGARDPLFQGYGTTRSDSEGRYGFRTIRPVPYGSRTPHIHFKVHPPEGETLTTQMYVAGEPLNGEDWIYSRLSEAEKARLSVELKALDDEDGTRWAGHFPIVLPR